MNSQPKLSDGLNECTKTNSVLASRQENGDWTFRDSQGDLKALDVLFSRYRRTLILVAFRMLGDHRQAEDAVRRCLQSAATRNMPRFKSEGAFRSWLFRVLIDVAWLILREREWATRLLRADRARIYPICPDVAWKLLS
jgi:DNA-directed RNA polymerase specialized sigma24 family protein